MLVASLTASWVVLSSVLWATFTLHLHLLASCSAVIFGFLLEVVAAIPLNLVDIEMLLSWSASAKLSISSAAETLFLLISWMEEGLGCASEFETEQGSNVRPLI